MAFSRRSLLVTAGTALVAGATGGLARAQGTTTDTRITPRELGDPKAKIVVEEWFSLTCIHCAHFAENTFPLVKKNLIDTGKIRYVFHDFPTDQLATVAAMVARTLPPERYEAFAISLLSSLDRWAYVQDGSPLEALKKMAAFAGMPGETFDKTVADQQLMQFILAQQTEAQDKYHFDSTPTFRFNNKIQVSNDMDYETFAKNVTDAS
ncbi:thioredoxin domain-containing protein [Acetobacter tropicalis]|uniref:Thiol:disulfide interchange protein n=3 Tax=Acetobacter TaxID=434 RepID=A0A149U1C2_9PROT|nr:MULTISPECIES: thioredoxin domain-containing protein [Acetobacter]ATJ92619.1 thiol:disulfide interchange protein [Acetobacter tropicalis]KXV46135.1 thiol:disulfide interchange protein [Acetobacter tropicalis]KXV59157.1 thiol:disulfide interchange protein [Acetobacter senegalensis]MCC6103569.1 DsbA family protein [Acetobacter sp.]MCG4252966.1 DsbA family protein [Acetobacter senegalensis]